MVSSYQELIAWQRGMDLVVAVYALTRRFPPEEQFGLTHQLRRAAVSIPSNIAEGQGRGVGKEFGRYLRISNGSRQEAETQMLVGERLKYVSASELEPVMALAHEVGRLIRGLQRSVG